MKSVLPALKTLGILAGFGALSYGSYIYVVRFGDMDPFAKFRNMKQVDMRTGIELGNVRLTEYHKGKLMAQARIARITVTQDRSLLEMSKIQDGVYHGGSPVKFASDHGAWDVNGQQLQLAGPTRVAGGDFNIQSEGAILSRDVQLVRVPNKLKGTLFGGNFSASNLEYSIGTGDASAHLMHWQGKPQVQKLEQQVGQKLDDQEPIVARSWDIDCDYSQKKGNITIYNNAKATDGEMLVYAPKVEWNKTTDVLTATGRVSYFSGKADVLADKVVVYRKEKRAVFTGNVLMLVKSKRDQDKPPVKEPVPEVKKEDFDEQFKLPDKPSMLTAADKEKIEALRNGKNVRDYPLHLQAQDITYWYGKGERHAVFSGNPVARQEFTTGQWRMGWSFDGTYDGEKEILNLTSEASKREVRYKNSVGDIAQASKAQFSTKDSESEDDEDVQFWDVSGIFKDSSGEDSRAPKGQKTSPAAGGTTPPPGTTPPGTIPPGGTTTPPVKNGS